MTKDWVHSVGHSPICQILSQIVVRAVITSSSPALTILLGCCRLQLTSLSSVIVLQPPLLCEGLGGNPLCLSGDSSVLLDLHCPCDCTAQCRTLSIGSVSLVLLWGISWTILDSSCFSLFHSGQVFHELVCLLTVVLPQIFFNLTTLFSYPVFFALFTHLLMLLFTFLYFSDPSGSNLYFLSSLLLSHRSRFSAVI